MYLLLTSPRRQKETIFIIFLHTGKSRKGNVAPLRGMRNYSKQGGKKTQQTNQQNICDLQANVLEENIRKKSQPKIHNKMVNIATELTE